KKKEDDKKGESKETKKTLVGFLQQEERPMAILGSEFFKFGRMGRYVRQDDLRLMKKILDEEFVDGDADEPEADDGLVWGESTPKKKLDLSELEDRPDV